MNREVRFPLRLSSLKMEYGRIHKIQEGVISPSKLRMKLLGAHHLRRKEGGCSSSTATSHSIAEDIEFIKNSLLASKTRNANEGSGTTCFMMPTSVKELLSSIQGDQSSSRPPADSCLKRKSSDTDQLRTQQDGDSRSQLGSASTVHPMRASEEEEAGGGFEFPRGERAAPSIPRPLPSKWNDAEKWIAGREAPPRPSHAKRAAPLQGQGNRPVAGGWARVAAPLPPESALSDCRAVPDQVVETKKMDSCLNGAGISAKPVCTRDMGTEMTPIASQEPSRTSTPMAATTPSLSPNSSLPSTPRIPASTQSRANSVVEDRPRCGEGSNAATELSEQEQRRKTRSEIVALGVKLGKMNIAAWASKNDFEEKNPIASPKNLDFDQLRKAEVEARAVAWEEAEKSKHIASFRREEVKIQVWESHQKAVFEAKMQEVEVQVAQMRAQAQKRMMKKLARTRQQLNAKLAAAAARKSSDAARAARQAEYIRRTGRAPPSHLFCCRWFS